MDRLQVEFTLWAAVLGLQLETLFPSVVDFVLASNQTWPVTTGADGSSDATSAFDSAVWKTGFLDKFLSNFQKRAIEALQWRFSAVDDGTTWLPEAVSTYSTFQFTDSISFFHSLTANSPSWSTVPSQKSQICTTNLCLPQYKLIQTFPFVIHILKQIFKSTIAVAVST